MMIKTLAIFVVAVMANNQEDVQLDENDMGHSGVQYGVKGNKGVPSEEVKKHSCHWDKNTEKVEQEKFYEQMQEEGSSLTQSDPLYQTGSNQVSGGEPLFFYV